MLNVKIKLLREGAAVPAAATAGSAAADVRALLPEPVTIEPGGSALIPTGFAISIPSAGFAALLFARSGLAVKHGISLSNGVGVIDSDYTGEVMVGLKNGSSAAFTVRSGDRIAQLAIVPCAAPRFAVAGSLDKTDRGSGGFGSTGI